MGTSVATGRSIISPMTGIAPGRRFTRPGVSAGAAQRLREVLLGGGRPRFNRSDAWCWDLATLPNPVPLVAVHEAAVG